MSGCATRHCGFWQMPLLRLARSIDRSRKRHRCSVMSAGTSTKERSLVYISPVVSKNYLDYPDGNFEFADNLEPVAINLVSYINFGKNFPVVHSQQVIVTAASVFKPNIS